MDEEVVLYLNYAVYMSFAVTLVAMPFMVINMVRAVNKKSLLVNDAQPWIAFPIKSVMFFAGSIIVGMFLSTAICTHARNKVINFIEALPNNYKISVDGYPVSDGKNLIAALKVAHSTIGHHSHPSKTIHVDFEANGQVLHLNLDRDSQIPQEYWVFYPGYRVSSTNQIGRITTETLDSY